MSVYAAFGIDADYLSQGCEETSLYSPQAFEVPYGFSLPYAVALGIVGFANEDINPYASATQSQYLRVIESTINPRYQGQKRYGRTEHGLRRYAIADLHIADRIQSGFSLVF